MGFHVLHMEKENGACMGKEEAILEKKIGIVGC